MADTARLFAAANRLLCKTLTMTATPIDPPTRRVMLSIPEAVPIIGGETHRRVSPITELSVQARPTPVITNGTTNVTQLAFVALTHASNPRPRATHSKPKM